MPYLNSNLSSKIFCSAFEAFEAMMLPSFKEIPKL